MNSILAYLAARAKEPSTWAGLAGILAGVATVYPPAAHALTTAAGFCGALAMGLKEQNGNKG